MPGDANRGVIPWDASPRFVRLLLQPHCLHPPPLSAENLVLYTSQPDADAAETVDAFKAANPGVEVEIFRSGTSDLMTKLAAEFAAGSPQPTCF